MDELPPTMTTFRLPGLARGLDGAGRPPDERAQRVYQGQGVRERLRGTGRVLTDHGVDRQRPQCRQCVDNVLRARVASDRHRVVSEDLGIVPVLAKQQRKKWSDDGKTFSVR